MKNPLLALIKAENVFFQLTNDSKRVTHIALSSFLLPVFFLIISALLTQNVFAPLFFGDPTQASSSARQAFGLYAIFGTVIFFIFLWIKFFEGRSFRSIGFTKEKALKKYLFGFFLGFLMNTIVIGIMASLGNIESSQENAFVGINVFGSVLLFLFGYVIQGSGEEIIFRGWMFQVIGARYKPWLGVLITTILFSLVHLNNSGTNLFSIINLMLVSILLILFVIKDGSIWSACAWHTAWNWTLGNVYGLSVSGTSQKDSILALNTTGNDLISGGQFGPEASVIVTFVLSVAITHLAIIISRNQRILKNIIN